MAVKAIHASDVPNLDQVPETAALSPYSTPFISKAGWSKKFTVIGHRGNGMNKLSSSDPRMKALKENSLASFSAAAALSVDFVEFDVQVTKDGIPIIFHDDFILTQENGIVSERKVTEITLAEFLSYGPQREPQNVGKCLFRKLKDGKVYNWKVEHDDSLCTLQEAFQKVDPSVGFNIELKFDDYIHYHHQELLPVLQIILRVVFEYARDRPVIFSTFQPDAASLIRKLQNMYSVFFLTEGGVEIYKDVRRNSLEEAVKLCLANGLQGIVSEVRAVFRNPGEVSRIKESNLSLLTYGQLNNVTEAVYLQHLMGVDGVIVDFVRETTEAVSDITKPVKEENASEIQVLTKPTFSQPQLSFLLKLIPKLVQH